MVLYIANIHGDFNTGAEHFQHSIAISDDGTSSPADQADVVRDALDGALTSSQLMTQLSSKWRYTHVTVAEVLSQAPVRLSAAVRRDLAVAAVGSNGNRTLPPQCAVVVSLTADPYANGSPVRGRMYMPPCGGGLGINDDGSLIDSVRDHYGNWAAALIGSINDVGSARFAAVWSRLGSGKGTGQAHQIRSIRVGNRIDTVRSRRKAITEQYAEYSFSSV